MANALETVTQILQDAVQDMTRYRNRSLPRLTDDNPFITNNLDRYDHRNAAMRYAASLEQDAPTMFFPDDMSSVQENYHADFNNYSLSAPKLLGKKGGQGHVNFNVAVHPDDACKKVLSIPLYLLHSLPDSILTKCETITHKNLGSIEKGELDVWMGNQLILHNKHIFKYFESAMTKLLGRTGGVRVWLKAGFVRRMTEFGAYFDQAPITIVYKMLNNVAEVYDVESVHGPWGAGAWHAGSSPSSCFTQGSHKGITRPCSRGVPRAANATLKEKIVAEASLTATADKKAP